MNLNHARLPIPPPGLVGKISKRKPSGNWFSTNPKRRMLQPPNSTDNRELRILALTAQMNRHSLNCPAIRALNSEFLNLQMQQKN